MRTPTAEIFHLSPDALSSPGSEGRPSVMVVEDDSTAAKALEDVLTHAHFEVELVRTAELALEALAARSFSLAIVDIHLPGMGGKALLERMAQEPSWARIPTIVVSGHVAVLPFNAVAFLRKPIQTAELLSLAHRYATVGGAPE